MIPVAVNLSPLPVVPALVSTGIPGTIALRVPADNVPPSVSSAAVGQDARGNTAFGSSAAPQTSETPAPSQTFRSFFSNTSADGIATAQTNFFAQLIGQGGGDDARSFLVIYEKLLQMSEVRYKPSNAGQPEPQPADVFGKLLQEEKATTRTAIRATAEPAAQLTSQTATASAGGAPQPVREIRYTRTSSGAQTTSSEPIELHSYATVAPKPAAKREIATHAYTATIVRNNSQNSQQTLESA